MRKKDYLILANIIRRPIDRYKTTDRYSPEWQQNAARIESEFFSFSRLGRYLSEHLDGVNKTEFLKACGL